MRSVPCRFGLLLTLALLVAAPTGAAKARNLPTASVSARQPLATLLAPHEVFAEPSRNSARIGVVQASRSLTGAQTVLPVLGSVIDNDGGKWLHVRLPGRPNSHTGWIQQLATRSSTTAWHIVVETSRRLVIVYQSGRRVRTAKAVVGKPSTPTPHGEFFVEESVALPATEAGAPFALALSARSNVLQQFDGGPGQIAIHGTAHLRDLPGTAASHGCVRLDSAMLRWVVARIGPGAPVTITS
jgi:lipoprotein-anchoring transpeptidase ErfK/SrfK